MLDAEIVDKPKVKDPVLALQGELGKLPQVDLQTAHLTHGGMYARTIFIPAGVALTGAKTNIANICIVSGDITVSTDTGVVRLTGYHVIPANAGFRRAGFAHADTYWTTLLHTEMDDLQAIEDAMTDQSATLQTRTLAISSDKTIKVNLCHSQQ